MKCFFLFFLVCKRYICLLFINYWGGLRIFITCICPLMSLVILFSIKDASLQQLIKDSTDLRNRYRHFFDYTIVNKVIDDTVETIVKHLNDIESASGWIPASWHYWSVDIVFCDICYENHGVVWEDWGKHFKKIGNSIVLDSSFVALLIELFPFIAVKICPYEEC